MINIDLTLEQVAELKAFYTNELDKILKRADEIKEILEKFAVNQEFTATLKVREQKPETQIKTETQVKSLVQVKKERQPKKIKQAKPVEQPIAVKQPKKIRQSKKEKLSKTETPLIIKKRQRTKKQDVILPIKNAEKQTKWSDRILELLNEIQKPLTIKEILNIFEKKINIPKPDLNKAFSAIQQSLYRLRRYDKKIQDIKREGISGKYYGLAEWAMKPESIPLTSKAPKSKKVKDALPKEKISKTITKQKDELPSPYNWPKFVNETLNKTKRILTANELLRYAMKYFGIPANERSRTRGKLSPALSRLEKTNKTLNSTKKKGVKGRAYGLTEWFDIDGNLIPEYK